MRGGARQRFVHRWTAPFWCPAGRWGPRRVRTNECQLRIRSEDLYVVLVRQAAKGQRLGPGCAGTSTYKLQGRTLVANWEVRANSVWRFGRVFFRCCRCSRLCTRLYAPLAESELGCRRCYGLSYVSQTHQNYKDSIWGRGHFANIFGTTQRDWAYMSTNERRSARREAAAERWRKRKRFFRKAERVRADLVEHK